MARKSRWVERVEFDATATTRAAPATVYDLIADLRCHLEWGGNRLPPNAERLLSMDAPPGEATTGTEFSSTGHTSIGVFHDRSRVTHAERPSRFEFVTDSRLVRPDGTTMHSTFEHRLLIEPAAGGTSLRRTVRQVRFYEPAPWWMAIFAWPPVAATLYRWLARAGAGAALRQLVEMAEAREGLQGEGDGHPAAATSNRS